MLPPPILPLLPAPIFFSLERSIKQLESTVRHHTHTHTHFFTNIYGVSRLSNSPMQTSEN